MFSMVDPFLNFMLQLLPSFLFFFIFIRFVNELISQVIKSSVNFKDISKIYLSQSRLTETLYIVLLVIITNLIFKVD